MAVFLGSHDWRTTDLVLYSPEVQHTERLAFPYHPLPVVLFPRNGVADERKVLQHGEAPQRREVGKGCNLVVREDEGGEAREGEGDARLDARDEIVREEEVCEAVQVREVAERQDVIVGEVERVHLVACHAQVLDGGELEAAEVDLAVLERIQV